MLSGPYYVTSIGSRIKWLAGYYTDYDRLQHVIVAAEDGYVYEVHWNLNHPPSPQRLGEHEHFSFNNMATIAGFFTPDDKYHHAVVGTSDGTLHEFYYKLDGSLRITDLHKTDLPSDISGFQDRCGMASFYSPYDRLRHVVIIDRMGKLADITWTNALTPEPIHSITIPLSANQIASISGFLSHDENPNTRHIIVAQIDHGQIYDIDYPDEDHVPLTAGQNYVKTSFDYPVRNVTAFFSSDNNYRHIVVLTRKYGENWLFLRAYDTYGRYLRSTELTSLPDADVADITSFYNASDQLCHVLYATHDGSLSEVTYTSQG